jgi:hypothetical protein
MEQDLRSAKLGASHENAPALLRRHCQEGLMELSPGANAVIPYVHDTIGRWWRCWHAEHRIDGPWAERDSGIRSALAASCAGTRGSRLVRRYSKGPVEPGPRIRRSRVERTGSFWLLGATAPKHEQPN